MLMPIKFGTEIAKDDLVFRKIVCIFVIGGRLSLSKIAPPKPFSYLWQKFLKN